MFKEKAHLLENRVWNKGNVKGIRKYYEDSLGIIESQDNKDKMFYNLANETDRIIHSGLPKRISDTIVDLIGVDTLKLEMESGDKVELEDIYQDHNLLDKFEEIVNDLTWAGEGFLRMAVYDGKINIERVNPLFSRKVMSKGRVIAYEFITWLSEEDTERTVDVYGAGYIETQTQELINDQWTVTSSYKIVFGTERILASHIEISSDSYSTSIRVFDAIDEIKSRMIDEFRKGKMERFIDENLLPKNENGESMSVESVKVQDWIKLRGSQSEDGKPLIEYVLADIDPEKRYLKAERAFTKSAVGNSGISWHTFDGGDVKSGISAEAQRELEKVSIRTRRRYIHRLKPFINSVLELLVLFTVNKIDSAYPEDAIKQDIANNRNFVEQEEVKVEELTVKMVVDNVKVITTFDDYIQNDIGTRVKLWGSQEAIATFPIDYRIRKALEGDVSEDEIKQLTSRVQNEQGISEDITKEDE